MSTVTPRHTEMKLAQFKLLLGTVPGALLKVRPEAIQKFYKTMAIPIRLYDSETWTLNASQIQRLVATEMRLFRSLPGYTLFDHKRNLEI